MEFIYATGNKGKIEQVKKFFESKKIDIKIESLKDIEFNEEIDENGATLEENSMIKAKAVKKYCDENGINKIIIADDTGLMVDALNGAPGVHSARYAGDHAPQEVAINKLLNEMKNVKYEDRTAHFECVLTAILPNGEVVIEKGTTNGMIAENPGSIGKLTFGPVFIPEGFDVDMNEIDESLLGDTHREKAFVKLIEKLKDMEEV